MPAVSPRIVHGALPDTDEIINEPNMIVQSLTRTAAREKKAFKGGNKCTQALEFTDPTLTFDFDAIISERSGLCDQHPGTAVAGLLNFDGAYRQFDPNDGVLVFEDPSDEQSVENPEMTKFKVVHYPFIAAA